MEKEMLGFLERIAVSLEDISEKLDILVKNNDNENDAGVMDKTPEKSYEILDVRDDGITDTGGIYEENFESLLEKSFLLWEKGNDYGQKKEEEKSPGFVNVETPAYEEKIQDRTLYIKDYLDKRGISLAETGTNLDEIFSDNPDYAEEFFRREEELNQLAKYIGEKFEYLGEFCNAIKRNINDGCKRPYSLDLTFSRGDKWGYNCQLGDYLNKFGFLSNYDRYNPTRQILFNVKDVPEVKPFLLGGWFERYIQIKAAEVINKINGKTNNTLRYSYIPNMRIQFAGGKKAEFDMMMEINGEIFWLEMKTENMTNDSARKAFKMYHDYAEVLKLNSERVFVIHNHPQNSYISRQAQEFYNISVVSMEEFSDRFRQSILSFLRSKTTS